MVEPQHKRVKLPGRGGSVLEEDFSLPLGQLQELHRQLCHKCLCSLSLLDILQTLHCCKLFFSQSDKIAQNMEGSLLYTSLLSLFFEVALKQQNKGIVCTRISEVVLAGAENESDIIAILFNFLAHKNKFLSYSSMRALVSLLLIMQTQPCELVMERLCSIMSRSNNILELGHSFEVLRRVIEFKDMDEHPLDSGDSAAGSQPSHCNYVRLSLAEVHGANEIKYIAIKILDSKWDDLVSRFPQLLRNYSLENEHVIVSFLSLWEALISVKNNLNVEDTKEFYNGLDVLVTPLLRHNTPLIVWSNIVDLFNEVLCYGSTLALQEVIAEEPCNLAHMIIRAINNGNLFEFVPCGQSAEDGLQSRVENYDSSIANVSEGSRNSFQTNVVHSRGSTSSNKGNPSANGQKSKQSCSSDDSPRVGPSSTSYSCSHNHTTHIVTPSCSSASGKFNWNTNEETSNPFRKETVPSPSSSSHNYAYQSQSPNDSPNITSYKSNGISRLQSSFTRYDSVQKSRLHDDSLKLSDSKNSSTSAPIMDICTSLRDVLSPTGSDNSSQTTDAANCLEQSINGLQLLQNYCDDEPEEDSVESVNFHVECETNLTQSSNSLDSSLQSVFPKESCDSLEALTNSHYTNHELSDMGVNDSDEAMTGFSSDHHRSVVVFHKVVLLVLKSIAITVKEARGDASSSSSESSSPCSGSSETEDMDMEIIGRSLKEVLVKVDAFVKNRVPFHPECPIAEWLVRLFASQDDWMVEAMVCGLDIYNGLNQNVRGVSSEVEVWLNPHASFISFLNTLCYDHTVLLDLLVSNETCFLLYLLRYLKLTKRCWTSMQHYEGTSGDIRRAVSVMFRLRLSIDKLVSKNLFPYNISPVLKLLDHCYQLFGGSEASS